MKKTISYILFLVLSIPSNAQSAWELNPKILNDTIEVIMYPTETNYKITDLFDNTMDSRGNLWFTSDRWGVININKEKHKQFFISKIDGNPVAINKAHTVKEINGKIFFGIDNGIVEFDYDKRRFKITSEAVFNLLTPYQKSVYAIEGIGKDSILVGSKYGLFLLDIKKNKIIKELWEDNPGIDGTSSHNLVHHISVDNKNKNIIWGVGREGLFYLNKKELVKKNIPYKKQEKLKYYYMYDFVQADKNLYIFYAGETPGFLTRGHIILKYNIETNEWTELIESTTRDKYNKLFYNQLHSIERYGKYIIFGARSYGMRIIDTETDEIIQTYLSHENLRTKGLVWKNPNRKLDYYLNDTYSLNIDQNGFLWAINTREELVRSKEPIFLNNQKLDFGKIETTNIFVNDKKYNLTDYKDPEKRNTYLLNETERDVGFSFEIPNSISDTLSYLYKLNNQDWKKIITANFIEFKNLGPGENALIIKALNGTEFVDEVQHTIVIKRKFYELIWVRILFLLSILSIIFLFFKLRINKIKSEELLKTAFNKKIAETEMQALRAQMNPHFLFNTMNSIKHFAINKTKEETANYITEFAQLLRQILNNSNDKIISLEQELEAIKLYLSVEQKRFENKFDYEISVDPEINKDVIFIPPLLIQPYIENAIWHGIMHKNSSGKIHIDIKEINNELLITIEDNGIGRKAANKIKIRKENYRKKSLGTKITSDRINLIEKIYGIKTSLRIEDLISESGEAKGTKVYIKIPLIDKRIVDNLR